jgi:hypothetical protein
MGMDDALGYCRLSCGVCAACAPGDRGCYNGNRRPLGYLEASEAEAHLFPRLRAAEKP